MAVIQVGAMLAGNTEIPNEVAQAVFARGTQSDLNNCFNYCKTNWPGDQQCLDDCKDMIRLGVKPGGDGRPIARADDPCRGGIDRYHNPCPVVSGIERYAGISDADEFFAGVQLSVSDVQNLYNQVSGGASSGNTGIGGGVVSSQESQSANSRVSTTTTSDNTTLYVVGGIAVAGLLAWIIFY